MLLAWLRGSPGTLEVAAGSASTGEFDAATTIAGEGVSAGTYGFELATNARGDAALAWGEPGKFLVSLRPAGGRFGPPIKVVESGGTTVALADDGRLLAVWVEHSASRDATLYARVRSPDGSLGEPQLLQYVENSLNAARIDGLSATWSSLGEPIVAWTSSPYVCDKCSSSTVYAASGWAGTFSPPQQLSSSSEAHWALDVQADGQGRAVVTWGRRSAVPPGFGSDDIPNDIRLAERPPGGSFSSAFTVANGQDPVLTATSRDFFVAWLTGFAYAENPADRDINLFGTFRPEDSRRRITMPIRSPAKWIGWTGVAAAPAGDLVAAWTEGQSVPEQLFVSFGPEDPVAPSIRRVSATRRVLIRGRHALVLGFRLSEPAEVELQLRRGGTRRAQLTRNARLAAGRGRIRIGPRRLRGVAAGRYRATLRATDAAGQRSVTRAISIRIKRAP